MKYMDPYLLPVLAARLGEYTKQAQGFVSGKS
jgi:predicted ATPase